eukprot:jgi/Picsp_1/4583/NSC_01953-R1_protein
MPQVVRVSKEQLGIDAGEEYAGSLDFDLGNLAAFDNAPVDAEAFKNGIDTSCQRIATQIFQSMTHKLFDLPFEVSQLGRIAELPAPSTALPREKPLPKPRPPTKWEIFAQRKGITKRKKSNLEWDQTTQEWRRRHGYKRVNDESDIPIIEAGHDESTGVQDPFSKAKSEKKERLKKQSDRQLANLKSIAKQAGQDALPTTLRLAASLPEHGRGKPTKRREMLPDLVKTSRQVAVSTASMGKHDKALKGENLKHRKLSTVKRSLSATAETGKEREAQGKLVDHILRKNADDIMDIGKAIGKFEANAREQEGPRMKKKGANKKGRLEGKQPLGKKNKASSSQAAKTGKRTKR